MNLTRATVSVSAGFSRCHGMPARHHNYTVNRSLRMSAYLVQYLCTVHTTLSLGHHDAAALAQQVHSPRQAFTL